MIDNIYSGNYVKPFVMLDEAGWIPCISHLGSLQQRDGVPTLLCACTVLARILSGHWSRSAG